MLDILNLHYPDNNKKGIFKCNSESIILLKECSLLYIIIMIYFADEHSKRFRILKGDLKLEWFLCEMH